MRSVPGGPATPSLEAGVLAAARDSYNRSPHEWLADAVRTASPLVWIRRPSVPGDGILDLRCGGTVLAHHDRMALRTNSVGAVALDMFLPSLPALDSLFHELRRVLRPAGTFAALVPARPNLSPTELRAWWSVHHAVGGRPRFRHESARDNLHWLAAAADFAVLSDERRVFWIPVPDADRARWVATALSGDGVWPPDSSPDRIVLAGEALARYARPGRMLPVPLRLLVARR